MGLTKANITRIIGRLQCLCVLMVSLFLVDGAKGQVSVTANGSDRGSAFFAELEEAAESSSDSLELGRSLGRVVRAWRESGYLQANIDKLEYDVDSVLVIHAHLGPQYEWAYLRIRGIPDALDGRLGKYPRRMTDQAVNVQEVMSTLNEAVRYSEEHGYPFAMIQVDSLVASNGLVSAALVYESGPLIRWDSLRVLGNAPVKSSFLGAYLGITPGKPFRQSILEEAVVKLQRLPYLALANPPVVTFQNEEARLTITVEARKSNRFDAVVGVFPNERAGGELLITGAVDLALNNLFRSGKSLELHWDRPQVETQTLRIGYAHPNLFLSPLGLSFSFDLFKQDTSFINRQMALGFDYVDIKNNSVSLFSRWESSRLISTTQFQADTVLPEVTDYNINYLGLRYRRLPKMYQDGVPNSYWSIDISSAFGTKNILKNSDIDESLYTGVQLRSNQFSGEVKIEGLANLTRNYFLMGRIRGGTLANAQLFKNELFRLGGLNSIRGFNENFFFASDYAIATIEGQLFFNGLSNLFLFYDQAFVNQRIGDDAMEDTPFGFGTGLRLASDAGVFSLVYALGQSAGQPLDLRFSKIHFGYVATF